MDAVAGEHRSNDLQQVYEDHVVGQDVTVAHGGVGGLLPPLLEAQVEDGHANRQDEGEVNDAEDGDADNTDCWIKAAVHMAVDRKRRGDVSR